MLPVGNHGKSGRFVESNTIILTPEAKIQVLNRKVLRGFRSEGAVFENYLGIRGNFFQGTGGHYI